jgi:hypothetical protein
LARQDYFEDLERWLDSSFYKRLAAKALERCVGAFAERLLDGRSGLVLRVEAVEQMEADEEALLGLFERHLNHAQVRNDSWPYCTAGESRVTS